MTVTPAYLAEFIHRVPAGARIPDGEEYVVDNTWFKSFSLRTSDGVVIKPDDNPHYTREPISTLLPTGEGSLVIAHTAWDPTRRPFLLGTDDVWFGPGPKGLPWSISEALINPVPAKVVEVSSHE